jgi:hypothetical protein
VFFPTTAGGRPNPPGELGRVLEEGLMEIEIPGQMLPPVFPLGTHRIEGGGGAEILTIGPGGVSKAATAFTT